MLKLVLYQLIIIDERFTCNQLNSRLKSFCYARHKKSDKPSSITFENLKSGDNLLGQQAVQYIYLSRLMGLIIGDLIDCENVYWQLVTLLMEIIDIVLCPKISNSLIAYSDQLIFDHYTKYRELFPTKRLTPKFHNLVHYPTCLQKFGPACQYWCMRFEGKYNQLKKSATSFKNVCKTVALKQQIRQCLTWHFEKNYGDRDVHSNAGKLVFVRILKATTAICDKLCIGMLDEVYVCRHTKINGTDYFSGDVLVTGRQNDESLQFALIDEFILTDHDVYFICQELQTHYYDAHYHAFAVENDDCGPNVKLEYDELLEYYPLALHNISGTKSKYSFVALRHGVVTSISK